MLHNKTTSVWNIELSTYTLDCTTRGISNRYISWTPTNLLSLARKYFSPEASAVTWTRPLHFLHCRLLPIPTTLQPFIRQSVRIRIPREVSPAPVSFRPWTAQHWRTLTSRYVSLPQGVCSARATWHWLLDSGTILEIDYWIWNVSFNGILNLFVCLLLIHFVD